MCRPDERSKPIGLEKACSDYGTIRMRNKHGLAPSMIPHDPQDFTEHQLRFESRMSYPRARHHLESRKL
jgi:hypothetical protein